VSISASKIEEVPRIIDVVNNYEVQIHLEKDLHTCREGKTQPSTSSVRGSSIFEGELK